MLFNHKKKYQFKYFLLRMSSNYNYSVFHQNTVKHFLYLHVLLKAICSNNTLENREKTGFTLSNTKNLTRINTEKPYLSIQCSRKQRTCRILKQATSLLFLFIFQKRFLAATTKAIFATTALLALSQRFEHTLFFACLYTILQLANRYYFFLLHGF